MRMRELAAVVRMRMSHCKGNRARRHELLTAAVDVGMTAGGRSNTMSAVMPM